jgi:hypothetical protein
MNIVYENPLLFSFLCLCFAGLFYALFVLLEKAEILERRLATVSKMLQHAEYTTGVPFFTSLGNHLPVEKADIYLLAIKTQILKQKTILEQE